MVTSCWKHETWYCKLCVYFVEVIMSLLVTGVLPSFNMA